MKFSRILQVIKCWIKCPGIRQVAMGCKPDPLNFTIKEIAWHGGNTLVLAVYHGCKSFNGEKLMVLKGEHPSNMKVLDPHFLDKDYPVVARFAPTNEGRRLARLCLENLGKREGK